MNEFKRKQWTRIGLSVIAVVVAVLFLTGVIGGKPMTYQVKEPLTPMLQVITDTMEQNKENDKAEDYLEQDPYLVNIYEGYGFAKDYKAARGHAYTLEDVTKTQRPHAKANCITCKTPDFTKIVNAEGVEVYSRPFDEVMEKMTQAISCYTCHGDDKGNNGQIVITHSYVDKALGENASEIDPKVLNCGQCHIEYYFTPEDSETMMPYHSQEEMTPEAILAYYDEMGFKDWEQPGTGTPMLKAQHPEMETFLSSKHAVMGLNCASCHMAEETAEDGSTYHSHYLVSPLKSEKLMATCTACHGSADAAKSLVTSTQEKVTARETEVGNRLSGLKDALAAAVTEAIMTEEELDAVRKLHREAQWFFDFCYVENSEGAHNSSLSNRCLDTADSKITEAMALLNGEEPQKPTEEEQPETGTASVKEQGFGGEITVSMELNEDGTVKSLSIDTPNETAGLGQRASEAEFTDQFIGKKGPFDYGQDGIEAISGATVTSTAALKAINRLAAEGGPVTAEAVPDTETEEKPSEEKPAEEKPAEDGSETDDEYYASYLAEKETPFSTIRMTVSEKDGKITDCKITSEAKSEGSDLLTDEIKAAWAEYIVSNQSVDLDAVSGVTVSSNAMKEAFSDIQALISGGNSPEEPQAAEEKTAEEKPAEAASEKTTEADSETDDEYCASYLAEKETPFSTIRMTVSEKDGKITECKITSEAKSEGSDLLTDEIKAAWAECIVSNQSADLDAVSGVTVSSNAMKEAFADIRALISGETKEPVAEAESEKPEEEPAAEPTEEPAAETTEEPAAEPEPEAESKKVPALFGSYLAVKETPFSVIRVIVSTQSGKITDCRVLCDAKEGQTDLVKDEDKEAWAKEIVETQGAEIDTVTGATVSSDAVKEAVAEILELIR